MEASQGEGRENQPEKIEFIHNNLNFGDGTGFLGSVGKPMPEVKERGANAPCAGGGDGVIDARDAVFASLRLWRDANRDGLSQPEELHGLGSLGVTRLHLDYKESKRVDEHGNRFRYRAKVEDAKVNRRAWDVFLVRAP